MKTLRFDHCVAPFFCKLIILTECTIAGNETKRGSLKADREIGKFQIKLGEK